MQSSETNPLGGRAPSPDTVLYTLDPFRTHGPDALAPQPTDTIIVKLARLVLTFKDTLHQVITRTVQNVFGLSTTPDQGQDPLPEGADLPEAIFIFTAKDSPQPHIARIYPPNTIEAQSPDDIKLLLPWLDTHHFRKVQNSQTKDPEAHVSLAA